MAIVSTTMGTATVIITAIGATITVDTMVTGAVMAIVAMVTIIITVATTTTTTTGTIKGRLSRICEGLPPDIKALRGHAA